MICMRWLAISVRWHENSFGTFALPFCHKRFAASTSKTGTAGEIFGEEFHTSLGNGMVPKSLKRQAFLTIGPCKAKQFTLNSRQGYHSMLAIVPGKAHLRVAHGKITEQWANFDNLGLLQQLG